MADLLNGTGDYGFYQDAGHYQGEIDQFQVRAEFDGYGPANFVGINLETIVEIETAVKKTIEDLQNTVKDFGGDGKEVFEGAIKGKVVDAGWYYVTEVKELINRYIQNLQGLIELCADTAKALKEADTTNESDIKSSSDDIKSVMSDVMANEQATLAGLSDGY